MSTNMLGYHVDALYGFLICSPYDHVSSDTD